MSPRIRYPRATPVRTCMNARWLSAIALSAALAAPSAGCASIAQAHLSPAGPAAFGGVRRSASKIADAIRAARSPHVRCTIVPLELVFVVLALDFPFSLIADTLLPVSVPNEIREGGIDARR